MGNNTDTLSPIATTYDKIKITSPWEILSIENLALVKTLNDHAKLTFSALINESSGKTAALKESADERIECYIETEGQPIFIFKGNLQSVLVNYTAGNYTLTAVCLSESALLDVKEKSRSFQNVKLTYTDIAQEVIKDYSGKSLQAAAEKVEIGTPVIQYKETDWQFLKRLASFQQTVLVANTVSDNLILAFGFPKGKTKSLPPDIKYSSGRNINEYFKASVINPNIKFNDYIYFEVETYQELDIGDEVNFNRQNMSVGAVTAIIKDGVLVYNATLVKEAIIRQNPIYNRKLKGVSLEGKVLSVEKQTVKLELSIDQEMGRTQDVGQAYPFTFAPPTVDMMHLMPEKDTLVSLYIPAFEEKKAVITGQIRSNGQSCAKTSDPNNRYLTDKNGREVKLTPGGTALTAGKNDLAVSLDDKEGVILSSDKGIILAADEEILLDSKEKVSFQADSQIFVSNPNSQLLFDNEISLAAPTVVGISSGAPIPASEQAQQDPPPKEEKKGFSWGKLLGCVVAAVAVVAVVALVAVTCGVAGPIIVAGCMAAGVAIASTAVGDIISGENSSMSTYVTNGLVGFVVGAVSAALPVSGPLVDMLVDGVTGGIDYFKDVALGAREFDWKDLGMTVGISVGVGLAMRGAGKAIGNKIKAHKIAKGVGDNVDNAVAKGVSSNADNAVAKGVSSNADNVVAKGVSSNADNVAGQLDNVSIKTKTVEVDSGIWSENPLKRGKYFDEVLENNLGSNYPVVDKLDDGIVTSIKSRDLNAATYQKAGSLESRIKSDIDKLVDFNGRDWGGISISADDIQGRVLDIVIPDTPLSTEQLSAISNAVDYGKEKGIELIITIAKEGK